MGLFGGRKKHEPECDLCGTKLCGAYMCAGTAASPYYRMCMECNEKLIKGYGGSDIGYPTDLERAKRILIDPEEGMRYRTEILEAREKAAINCDFCGIKVSIGKYSVFGDTNNPNYRTCEECSDKLVKNVGGWDIGYPPDKETGKLIASDPEAARRWVIKCKLGEDDGCVYYFETKTAALKAYEDYVVIVEEPSLARALTTGIRGDKTIYYSDITAIQYKKPVGLLAGYIQFTIAGGRESTGGTYDAIDDENSIIVPATNDNYAITSEEIVNYMHKRLREIKSGKGNAAINNTAVSSADEILKYKQLLDAGIISQEEFDAKKKQLLGL